jgi:hypothetical protein
LPAGFCQASGVTAQRLASSRTRPGTRSGPTCLFATAHRCAGALGTAPDSKPRVVLQPGSRLGQGERGQNRAGRRDPEQPPDKRVDDLGISGRDQGRCWPSGSFLTHVEERRSASPSPPHFAWARHGCGARLEAISRQWRDRSDGIKKTVVVSALLGRFRIRAATRVLQNRLWGADEASQVGSIPIHPRLVLSQDIPDRFLKVSGRLIGPR